jgi:hypothetical protein
MKFLIVSLVLLNTIFLAYAQDPKAPTITCEQEFSLQGTTCSPCQQTLHEYPFVDLASTINHQPPSDKCLIFSIFAYYMSEETPTTSPDTTAPDAAKINSALDKTCESTANGACSDDHARQVYTEIEKNCEAELSKDTLDMTGTRALTTITTYYAAIPMRGIFCNKVGNEYCFTKFYTKFNQTKNESPFNSDILCNDDCFKKFYNDLKGYRDTHPLDSVVVQKLLSNYTDYSKKYETKCNVGDVTSSDEKGKSKSSNGQRIMIDLSNYTGMIFIGLIGLMFLNFM